MVVRLFQGGCPDETRTISNLLKGTLESRALVPGLILALLLLCPAAPRAQEDMAGEWEIFTKDGIERKPRSQPMQVNIGQPEVMDVPSAITGTGQGKKLENVEEVVKEGPGLVD